MIPIIPPGAAISPRSRVPRANRGKAPGKKQRDGWAGFDWVNAGEPSEPEMAQWEGWGASVGLRATRFPALDIDVLSPDIVEAVSVLAARELGPAPYRVGQPPKRILPYVLAAGEAPMPRRRLWFKMPGEQKPYLLEWLGAGQQYVVEGVHARTGKPYHWSQHPADIGAAGLTPVTADQVDAFFAEVDALLDMLGAEDVEAEDGGQTLADRLLVNQDDLAGPTTEAVLEVVRAIPNDNTRAPTRTDYLRMGYAIKAALQDDPEAAREAWTEWALRWPGNDRFPDGNDLEDVESDWDRMKPPYAVGWRYLRDMAVEAGHPVDPDEFGNNVLTSDPSAGAAAVTYAPHIRRIEPGLDPATIPPRPWVLGSRFMRGSVTVGIGQPGVGKSAMSILAGLAIATGRELTGERVFVPGGRVWIHNNEDSVDEMQRRAVAIARHHGIEWGPDLRDRFIFSTPETASGASVPLRLVEKLNERVRQTNAADDLLACLVDLEVVFLSVDPLVSTHSGISENDNAEIERVLDVFRRIAAQANCALDLPHHSVKTHSGDTEARAGDLNAGRGAGSLGGAVRSGYTLSRMSTRTAEDFGVPEADAARLIRMDRAKGNYSPADPFAKWFRLDSFDLGNGTAQYPDGDSVVVPEFLPAGLEPYRVEKAKMDALAAEDSDLALLKHAARFVIENGGGPQNKGPLIDAVAVRAAIGRDKVRARLNADIVAPGAPRSLNLGDREVLLCCEDAGRNGHRVYTVAAV